MRIFVSHSHEQRDLAAHLTARLRADGHRVFQDASSLAKGDAYDRRIREEIDASGLFVFLLSPAAVKPGCYALTELAIAQKRWPNPARHVLPVLVTEVPDVAVPPYLRAVSILMPVGDLVAEVVNEVSARASRRQRRWYAGAATAGLLASGLAATRLFHQPHPQADLPRPQTQDAGARLSAGDAGGVADARVVVDQRHADAAIVDAAIVDAARRHPKHRQVIPDAHPPVTRDAGAAVCRESIETKNGSFWLVCRCKDARTKVPGSLPVRGPSLDDARAGAERVQWHCP